MRNIEYARAEWSDKGNNLKRSGDQTCSSVNATPNLTFVRLTSDISDEVHFVWLGPLKLSKKLCCKIFVHRLEKEISCMLEFYNEI